jgi:hypothetical protein
MSSDLVGSSYTSAVKLPCRDTLRSTRERWERFQGLDHERGEIGLVGFMGNKGVDAMVGGIVCGDFLIEEKPGSASTENLVWPLLSPGFDMENRHCSVITARFDGEDEMASRTRARQADMADLTAQVRLVPYASRETRRRQHEWMRDDTWGVVDAGSSSPRGRAGV